MTQSPARTTGVYGPSAPLFFAADFLVAVFVVAVFFAADFLTADFLAVGLFDFFAVRPDFFVDAAMTSI